MQDPGRYLAGLDLALACPVRPEEPASLDPSHRIFINGDAWFVSSDEAVAEFNGAPYRYTGAVTDPVTGARFTPDESSPHREHDGRWLYFSSGETLAQFSADPEGYSTPKPGMVEKPRLEETETPR